MSRNPDRKSSLWLAGGLTALVAFAVAANAADPAVRGARDPRPRVEPGSEQRATVVFLTRIVNRGKTALASPRIQMHGPVELPHQTIAAWEADGKPQQLKDRWGSPVLAYSEEKLEPEATMTGRWAAWATIRRFQWDLRDVPEPSGPGAGSLSPEEQELCLRDAEPFALRHPSVRAAAEQASAGRSGTVAVLGGIFGLVMDRLSYERDSKWQPIPEVLASGKGSCGEYTLPWLDDLLYERATRVDAARACLEIGDKNELSAVVNCLGRLSDESGDHEIGRLLDGAAGQRFGSDRRKWEEWLTTQPPRTPPP